MHEQIGERVMIESESDPTHPCHRPYSRYGRKYKMWIDTRNAGINSQIFPKSHLKWTRPRPRPGLPRSSQDWQLPKEARASWPSTPRGMKAAHGRGQNEPNFESLVRGYPRRNPQKISQRKRGTGSRKLPGSFHKTVTVSVCFLSPRDLLVFVFWAYFVQSDRTPAMQD